MRETLKELNAELAVLHESLERAEVIERQLPAYLREIEAERDESIAERDQLRAEVERLRVEMALICRITKGNSADLSKPVDAVAEYVTEVRGRINAATARAEAAESTAAGLRRALEDIRDNSKSCAGGQLMAHRALAATPDDYARRIKSEALRATASELENLREHIQDYIAPDDARDDIRRICLNRAKDLRDEAAGLEATNGR